MPKKTQDLRELLSLMDDYVLAPKEREWLDSPLTAVQSRRPVDLIASGKLRDLIVEFIVYVKDSLFELHSQWVSCR